MWRKSNTIAVLAAKRKHATGYGGVYFWKQCCECSVCAGNFNRDDLFPLAPPYEAPLTVFDLRLFDAQKLTLVNRDRA